MKKIIKKVSVIVWLLSVVVMSLSAITYLFLRFYLLTPDVLASLLKKELSERTNVSFNCEEIGLDYLAEWPSVSLLVRKGMVVFPSDSAMSDLDADAVNLEFQTFGGKVNLISLITQNEIIIENLFLEGADVKVDMGRKMALFTKTSYNNDKQMQFNINEVRLAGINITVVDSLKSAIYHLDDLNLHVSGNLNTQHPSFDINNLNLSIDIEGDTPLANRQLLVTVKGQCEASENFHDIYTDGLTLLINQFPFQLEGEVLNIAKKEVPYMSIKASLLTAELGELLNILPIEIQKKQYVINGTTTCNVEIAGKIGKDEMPRAKLKGTINGGSIYRKGMGQGIDTINLVFSLNYDKYMPDSCYLDISKMRLSGMNSRIQIDGHISDYMRNPFLYGDLSGHVDFKRIGEELLDSLDVSMGGKVDADLSFAFNLNDMKEMNFHRLWAEGHLKTDNLKASSEKYSFNLFAKNADMSLGYKKNRSDFIEADEVLSCNASIDTLNFFYADTISCLVSKLNLRANTDINNDSNSVTPVTAHMNWDRLRGQLNTNTAFAVEKGELHVGSKPYTYNKQKMEGAVVFKADDTKFINAKDRLAMLLTKTNLISEFSPSSETAGKEFTLRNWLVKSQVDFIKASIISSIFPQRVEFKESRIGMRNNQLILNRLNVQSGNTSLLLSGSLTTDNDSTIKKRRVDGSLHLMADNLDFDEFSSLFLEGEAMQQETADTETRQYSITGLEESLAARESAIAKKKYPIYIPANLNLDIQLDIERAVYEEAELHQVRGNVEISDSKAHALLSMRTNVGKAGLNVVYDSRRHDQLSAIFDVDCHDVLLAQLHRVIPSISSMFPMINSLDGIADVHLTGQTFLDAEMESVLPSAKVAGTLRGQNLTLIDNSTFDEIASKLKFKNKNRNLIDKLEVNFILNESVIEVIPFIMEWDRYKIMAGGTNNLDLMYDYHIDMLESPIPINFGLDLTGKPKDFHFKVTFKRKYKELFKDGGIEWSRITAKKMDEARQVVFLKMDQILK